MEDTELVHTNIQLKKIDFILQYQIVTLTRNRLQTASRPLVQTTQCFAFSWDHMDLRADEASTALLHCSKLPAWTPTCIKHLQLPSKSISIRTVCYRDFSPIFLASLPPTLPAHCHHSHRSHPELLHQQSHHDLLPAPASLSRGHGDPEGRPATVAVGCRIPPQPPVPRENTTSRAIPPGGFHCKRLPC